MCSRQQHIDIALVCAAAAQIENPGDGQIEIAARCSCNPQFIAELKPEIKRFKGWTSTRGATSHAQLPPEAQAYLDALAEAIETPIAYLSTGPDRVEGCIYPGTFLAELIG